MNEEGEQKPLLKEWGKYYKYAFGDNYIKFETNTDFGLGVKSPSYWTTYKTKNIMKTHSYAFVEAASHNEFNLVIYDKFKIKIFLHLIPYRFIFLDY